MIMIILGAQSASDSASGYLPTGVHSVSCRGQLRILAILLKNPAPRVERTQYVHRLGFVKTAHVGGRLSSGLLR